MFSIILLIVIVILFVNYFHQIMFAIFHPKTFLIHSYKDIRDYFKYKKYNNFTNYGVITMFCAYGKQVFGSGKTISMIKDVINVYKQYNDKLVYDKDSGIFVKQHIHVISNVEINEIPYIKFTNVNQFIDIDKYGFGSMDIVLYVLDESGAVFNSREFKKNISSEMLTRLLQSRKNKCCLYMTSQRLQFTDIILRQICCVVYECSKQWRFVSLRAYNPLELEYAYNPEIVKPKSFKMYFCDDKLYNSYNTYQLVEQLNKVYTPLTNDEVLASYGNYNPSIENLSPARLSKKYKKGVQRKNE